ncbi:hypothetical protein B0O80DRAFT_212356 [Mortierella sp. GBAus27b]|nr:hypothetical protein B0O80DRAFT_212356 [Mortierella sp. GBAus27b]
MGHQDPLQRSLEKLVVSTLWEELAAKGCSPSQSSLVGLVCFRVLRATITLSRSFQAIDWELVRSVVYFTELPSDPFSYFLAALPNGALDDVTIQDVSENGHANWLPLSSDQLCRGQWLQTVRTLNTRVLFGCLCDGDWVNGFSTNVLSHYDTLDITLGFQVSHTRNGDDLTHEPDTVRFLSGQLFFLLPFYDPALAWGRHKVCP